MYPTPLFCSTRIKCSLVAALFSRNISLPLPLPLIRWKASTGSNHLIFLTRLRTIFVFRCRNIQIWSGKDGGGQLPWKWMQHLALRLAFPSLSSSSFPSRRGNKRSNKTTATLLFPPRIFTPWLWTNSYYSVVISSMNRFQPMSLCPMANILLYSVSLEVRMNDIVFSVYKSCLLFQLYIYISLRIIRTNIKFHGIWLEEKRFT